MLKTHIYAYVFLDFKGSNLLYINNDANAGL